MTLPNTNTNSPPNSDGSFGEFSWLFKLFSEKSTADAVIDCNARMSYGELLKSVLQQRKALLNKGVNPGDCVGIEAEFSPQSICGFLAVASLSCVVVPLSTGSKDRRRQHLNIANARFLFSINKSGHSTIRELPRTSQHPLLLELKRTASAGLILFSSGSTGEPKAAVHKLNPMIKHHRRSVPAHRTLGFLLFDHIGGLNTLFYSLANAGAFIIPRSNSVRNVVSAMSQHKAELFPTTPSFLSLLLASGCYEDYDLTSWTLATYGTEPMPVRTLSRLNSAFPNVTFKQTYGSTELGILPTRSHSSQSVLLTIDPDKLETKIENQRLLVRTDRRMMGYLNAPNPFNADGWMDTGDLVETQDNYIRIHGREDDVINVGGLKVHPHSVEEVIAAHDNVVDASVFGQKHALLGQTVVARIQFDRTLSPVVATRLIRRHCLGRLEPHMIPSKVIPGDTLVISNRFKRIRA